MTVDDDENAFERTGDVDGKTHAALPSDRTRHDEIAPIVEARLAALPDPPSTETETVAIAHTPLARVMLGNLA